MMINGNFNGRSYPISRGIRTYHDVKSNSTVP